MSKSKSFKTYETIIIYKADLTDDKIKHKIKSVKENINTWSKDLISRGGTAITKVEQCGRRKLAYEVKKQTQGYYVVFTYMTDPDKLPEFDRLLRIDDDVLKFMTIRSEDDEIVLHDLDEDNNIITPDDNKNASEQNVTRPLGQNHYDFLFGYTDKLA